MGARSRRKGAAFELLVAKMLQRVFPNARRRAMQARGGHEGADIDCTPGYFIECGHGKRMDPVRKWSEAREDLIASIAAYPTHDAFATRVVAVTKRDRGPILATLRLEDLVDLMALLHLQKVVMDAAPKMAEQVWENAKEWKNG